MLKGLHSGLRHSSFKWEYLSSIGQISSLNKSNYNVSVIDNITTLQVSHGKETSQQMPNRLENWTTEKDQLASKQLHPGLLPLHFQSQSITILAALCLTEPPGDRAWYQQGGQRHPVLTSTAEIATYQDKTPYLFSSYFREPTGTSNFQKDERSWCKPAEPQLTLRAKLRSLLSVSLGKCVDTG